MEIKFTIPLAPITKKNSQEIHINLKTGRPFIAPSKKYREYERSAMEYLPPHPLCPINYPVNIQCLFYLPTRRRTDLTNLLEAVDDLLVAAGVIVDDNYNIVAGHDGSRCYVDKDNPRTEIAIWMMPEESGKR